MNIVPLFRIQSGCVTEYSTVNERIQYGFLGILIGYVMNTNSNECVNYLEIITTFVIVRH
jgi:hypothetical protein